MRVFGSPAPYADEDRWRADAGAAFDRSFTPDGTRRQMFAVGASGSRADGLRQLDVPTLVIHGSADTLIDPIGGRRTAELIPGARFELIEGMGHDYPPGLWERWVDLVVGHALGARHVSTSRIVRSLDARTHDVDFLGIRIPEGSGPAILPVTAALCTPFGFLYGGCGIAACAVAAEAVTGRPLVWITTQYVANAKPGDAVELAVEVVVARPGDEPDPRPRHRRRAHRAARHDGPHRASGRRRPLVGRDADRLAARVG